MALSWNEIKDRAVAFSMEWAGTSNEEADAKPFLEAFFNVFGISRKRVSLFEHKVKKLDDANGYIDLFWKGVIVIEMKSLGKNLDKAFIQAKDYIHGLKEYEVPKYVLVSDFDTFRLFDTEEQKTIEFKLNDLVRNVQHFGQIAGYQKHIYKEQDAVNIKAAELMGKLHDKLKSVGYEGHPLEVYLVRLLFCLFADDTTIFDKDIFTEFIEQRTCEDGSDLAARLSEIFYILNTPKEKRLKNIDEQLNAFPYVNGKLFEENLPPAAFDTQMRKTLLECCGLNWGAISPAIFGSMFQSVMNPVERRNLGAHYTSEKNILKLIKPLFLNDLWKEYDSVKSNKKQLNEFHKKISELKFLDPACGCGNFLVITYRELRLLEIQILRTLYKNQLATSIETIVWLDVDMMYGIEYEEFPARIAEVAMWLIDHQMNMAISDEFGKYFVRLPLKKAANIVHGDALNLDWEILISKNKLNFILGNPPFIGSKLMKQNQRDDIVKLFGNMQGSGVLDYVSGWYIKAAKYIQNSNIKAAFVSTNSIVQGEQTSILWQPMFEKFDVKIQFAHRTFKWSNEAKGNAGVYCVIIGFANTENNDKVIFEYDDVKGEPHELKVKNINPYLVDAKNLLITNRSTPISDVPKMSFGNMPLDGGHLLLSDDEKNELISKNPESQKFIKPLISAYEFLNGGKRWCLWLIKAEPNELKSLPEVMTRIEMVRKFRLASKAPSTQKFAATPSLFRDRNEPETFIVIPRVSSENRRYIPMGFFDKNSIVSDTCMSIPNGTLYHFGVLNSTMHMAWVKYVCGRLESRFRYSKNIVYNNFPWPTEPNEKQIKNIEIAAQEVLSARLNHPDSSLADLYDSLTMPMDLTIAHQKLDRFVDLAYRPQPFVSEANRIEYLFDQYEKYTSDLFYTPKPKRKTSKS
jgi:hypothetical protein